MAPLVSLPASAAGSLARAVWRTGRRLPLVRPTLEQAVGGRVVMVTGASSGIGRATALRIGAAGGVVLLVARRAGLLAAQKIAQPLEGRLDCGEWDIGQAGFTCIGRD